MVRDTLGLTDCLGFCFRETNRLFLFSGCSLIIGMEFGFYLDFLHKVYLDLAGACLGVYLPGWYLSVLVYKTCFLLALIKFLPLVFLKRQSR